MPAPLRDHACAVLGGRATSTFLRRFWQKDALLVRAAIPRFRGVLSSRQLATLAMRDDVESRLVVRDRSRWSLLHGPFRRADFDALPERNWTLLVQGVNLHCAAVDTLLRRFAFLPYARLDDVMVSLAAPGGGVGPHFDSYDVFLLQGEGRRRWRYGQQSDLALRSGLPLKILRRFTPAHDEVLGPGDMLYLPPSFAHDGTAIDACMTYSIGFRAPAANELATAFLDWLRDRLALDGRYADPDLRASREPARIGATMQRRSAAMLAAIRWDREGANRFLGTHLSEPNATVFFSPPVPALSRASFRAAARRHGARLDLRTLLLYDDRQLFINGIACPWPSAGTPLLRRLANERALPAVALARAAPETTRLLYDWYRDGYLHPDSA
jgi:50S ribosomal protein L16 3-hydroxylase